jgi:hypothetical protein
MLRSLPTARSANAVMAGVVLFTSACSCGDEAGRAARSSQACGRFCRLVVRSLDETPNGPCQRGCLAELSLAGTACRAAKLDWMDCRIGAARALTVQPARPVDSEPSAVSCAKELGAARSCTKDCSKDGILQSGEQYLSEVRPPSQVSYEVRYHGCSPCGIDDGARAGAPCSTAKVCESKCYDCQLGRSTISLRACVDGHCAASGELQALLRQVNLLEVCVG